MQDHTNGHYQYNSDYEQDSNPNDPKRTYRKKKSWILTLNVTIDAVGLEAQQNENF